MPAAQRVSPVATPEPTHKAPSSRRQICIRTSAGASDVVKIDIVRTRSLPSQPHGGDGLFSGDPAEVLNAKAAQPRVLPNRTIRLFQGGQHDMHLRTSSPCGDLRLCRRTGGGPLRRRPSRRLTGAPRWRGPDLRRSPLDRFAKATIGLSRSKPSSSSTLSRDHLLARVAGLDLAWQ